MKVAIGTFNTRNLALPGIEFYPNEKYTQAEYERKKMWIAKQIDVMNCEIIGFQEVFHEQALNDVLSATGQNGYQIHYAQANPIQPRVAIASKYPVKNLQFITTIPAEVTGRFQGYSGITEFSRPILQAEIELPENKTITVLVSHLKSKKPTFIGNEESDKLKFYHIAEARSLIKRSVEAVGLREIIIKLIKSNNSPVVLLGDLNDAPRAVTSEIIAGPSPYKYLPNNEKIPYWDIKMYSAFDILTQKTLADIWYTHIYNGQYEILDHIYLSEEFYFRNAQRTWDVEYLKILNDHLADITNTDENLSKFNSDHAQVVVHLKSIP